MRSAPTPAIVLGLHPASRGFGWIVFAGPAAPLDWGITFFGKDQPAAYVDRLRVLIERHRPEVVVLEAPGGTVRAQSAGSEALLQAATDLADAYHLELHRYDRSQVRSALFLDSRASRQRTSEAVAEAVGALRHRLPAPRKPWEAQKRPVSLFSAAALALTHFATDDDERDYTFEPCG